MQKRTVIFTGGGSGGHVLPALTLIQELREDNTLEIQYIGSHNGIERNLVLPLGISYRSISTGKLRRYLSVENIKDLFRVAWGIGQAFFILRCFEKKKTLVFSTGGFVSTPTVLAARLLGLRIYVHEQTSRAGLANRIGAYCAEKIFLSFESSKPFFSPHKSIFSGYPLRRECFDKKIRMSVFGGIDLQKCDRPILFVTGGGNGSQLLNKKIRESLSRLTQHYFVVHQVGQRFEKEYQKYSQDSYLPLGLIKEGMIDLYKLASIIVSRAGAGTVCELMGLGKRSIFVPLKIAQQNEQYHNAMDAHRLLGSYIIKEDDFANIDLVKELLSFEIENSVSSPREKATNGLDHLVKEIKGGV